LLDGAYQPVPDVLYRGGRDGDVGGAADMETGSKA